MQTTDPKGNIMEDENITKESSREEKYTLLIYWSVLFSIFIPVTFLFIKMVKNVYLGGLLIVPSSRFDFIDLLLALGTTLLGYFWANHELAIKKDIKKIIKRIM